MTKPRPGQRKAAAKPALRRLTGLGSPGLDFAGIPGAVGNAVKNFIGSVVPNQGSAVIASAKRIQQVTSGQSGRRAGSTPSTQGLGAGITAAGQAAKAKAEANRTRVYSVSPRLAQGARSKVIKRRAAK
jgi:hypothetical protein